MHAPRAAEPEADVIRGLIVVDLTPMVDGYCANLARTFVLGAPDPHQRALLEAYATLLPVVRDAMCPGATVTHLDAAALPCVLPCAHHVGDGCAAGAHRSLSVPAAARCGGEGPLDGRMSGRTLPLTPTLWIPARAATFHSE